MGMIFRILCIPIILKLVKFASIFFLHKYIGLGLKKTNWLTSDGAHLTITVYKGSLGDQNMLPINNVLREY